MVTDHYYMPPKDPNRFLCSHEKEDGHLCNLSVAAHRLGHIDNAESDWDAGRISRVEEGKEFPVLTKEDYLTQSQAYKEVKDREKIIEREGHKDDSGKPAFFYLPWVALEDVARVMEYGANKYAAGNYQKGMSHHRYFSACVRHLVSWWKKEDIDPESGLPHLAHAACCILMLLENWKMGRGSDNRYME